MKIITYISKQIQLALTESAEVAAQKTRLVERKVKVNGTNLAQTLVIGWWHNPNATLEELTQVGRSLGLTISPQGLDQRFNKRTADFLHQLLQTIVNKKVMTKSQNIATMQKFTHVYLEDSSIVKLDEALESEWRGAGGSSSTSSVKLQTRLDIKYGTLDGPHLYDGRVHDEKASQVHDAIPKGSLRIVDLGFWSLKRWETAINEGFYMLSRFKIGTKFWVEGKRYEINEWCQQQQKNEFDVTIQLGSVKKLPVRLIGRRASKKESEKRRRKLKEIAHKQGFTPSKAQLIMCDWTVIVTNASEDLITTRDAYIWLGVRWQIELLFKLWKSVGEIDNSRSEKPLRHLCELYAKLIAMTLKQWLFVLSIWQYEDRSLTKSSKTIQLHLMRLATALDNERTLTHVIKDICESLSSGSRINKSKKHPRTFQKMHSLEGYSCLA